MASATSAPSEGRHPASRIGYLYNPFEVGVCGGDAVERSLVLGLLQATMPADVMGYLAPEGGADRPYEAPAESLDGDLAFVACAVDSPMAKIVCVDDGSPPSAQGVVAYVGRPEACPVLPSNAPYFTTAQVAELSEHVLAHVYSRADAVPLYGLVLVGGRSERMGEDKGRLDYHGKPQARYVYDLLSDLCAETFVSCRDDQVDASHVSGLPVIADRFLDMGPLSGILSALSAHPEAAWLVVACDLPFLSREVLENLIRQRNPLRIATAYRSADRGFPEPLCTIYEPKSIHRLLRFVGLGYQCPRKVLINSRIALLDAPAGDALANANSPEEYEAARAKLSGKAV